MSSRKGAVVLIVDDDPEILRSYARLLKSRLEGGVVVLKALSAYEGLKFLSRNNVDLILADYRMPEMDGIEFLAEARRLNPRIRRVIFTAYTEPELLRRASAEALVDDFVRKDVDGAELLARVQRLLAMPSKR